MQLCARAKGYKQSEVCNCVLVPKLTKATTNWRRGWLLTLEVLGNFVKEKKNGHSMLSDWITLY